MSTGDERSAPTSAVAGSDGRRRLDEFTRWRATLDSQPEMICRFRPDATITFVNRAYADQYDTEPDELIGKSVVDLVPDDAREWARTHIEELCRQRKPVVHENTVHLPDGTVRYYQWSDHVVSAPDGEVLELQAVGRDITERRLAEDALRASEQRLARMIELAPIGMALVDADGRIDTVNTALCSLLGIDEAQLLERGLDDLVADDTVLGLARARLLGGERVVELERRLEASEPAWGMLSISALDDNPERASLLVQVIDLTDRKRVEAELAHRAHHDPLTGLPNRAALLAELDEALAHARQEGEDVAVLFCDLDGFKLVNDTLGHEAGDALLVAVTVRLRECLRSRDMLARFGGDEFVIIHRGRHGVEGAVAHAERIIETLSTPITVSGIEAPVGVTVGVAVAEGGDGEGSALIRDADTAMYAAKADTRGTVRVCHDRLRSAVADRFSLQGELRTALSDGEFLLHYQPITRPDGRLVGLEALLRWRHPERGMLTPAAFLEIAEDAGLMAPIGAWVLEEACREMAALTADGAVDDDVGMWVNVTHYELADSGLPGRVRRALERAGLRPERLYLEISEQALPGDGVETLEELRAMGVGLAVDDFGTGTVSLVDLLAQPVDVIKFHGCLVSRLQSHERGPSMLSALIDLARAMEVAVVAEGVETPQQRDALDEIGCDYAQGYAIAPPAPVRDLPLAPLPHGVAASGAARPG